MLSRGSAASLLIQLSPVLSVWSSMVIHSFAFEQLLVPSEVAKLFLTPFREVFIFYGAQWMFALHVCVDFLGAVSSLAAHRASLSYTEGSGGLTFLFLERL